MFLLAALLAASVLPSTLATPKSEAGGEQGWTELMAHDELMAHAVTTACAAGYTDSYQGDIDAKTGILLISPTKGSCKPCSAGCEACTDATHCTTCNAPLFRSPLLGNHDGGFECVEGCDTAHGFAHSGDNCVVSDLKSATTASVEADLASVLENGHRRLSAKHRRLGGRRLLSSKHRRLGWFSTKHPTGYPTAYPTSPTSSPTSFPTAFPTSSPTLGSSVPSGITLPSMQPQCPSTRVSRKYKTECDAFRTQVEEKITNKLGDADQRASKKKIFDTFLSDCDANGIITSSNEYQALEVRL